LDPGDVVLMIEVTTEVTVVPVVDVTVDPEAVVVEVDPEAVTVEVDPVEFATGCSCAKS
jgi:hypothetical protein